ncbi:unnamed protein product [Darwinula stevensoni]|uniref:NADH:ubiquinone oxidoreductase intermediate-associated protein 30 domain-containing protein n=1 Tax=Darwinula stevensoni TaxID=69355 RepID=A0A7R8XKB2_9CRUS|nr:unnamed protein product [Darwinula stevensoni]CAG0896112.1 unnamed protein product [Darwinula stevensoni]
MVVVQWSGLSMTSLGISRSFFTSVSHRAPGRWALAGFHTSAPLGPMFWEKDERSGYKSQLDDVPRLKLVKDGLKMMPSECKKWIEEWKGKLFGDFAMPRPGIPDNVWKFDSAEDLSKWTVTVDADNSEGFSSAELVLSPVGKGLFQGNLCTLVPREGRIKRTGYCAMKSHRLTRSFQRYDTYDWRDYTHLVMRVRGDGRTYMLNLHTAGFYDILWNDMYQYLLFTRGGPHWQYVRIPFSKFFFSSKGRIQDKQFAIQLDRVNSLGIGVGDKINGPFRLEIDYIGVEMDPSYQEEFAYELYTMPKYTTAH